MPRQLVQTAAAQTRLLGSSGGRRMKISRIASATSSGGRFMVMGSAVEMEDESAAAAWNWDLGAVGLALHGFGSFMGMGWAAGLDGRNEAEDTCLVFEF